MIAMNRIKSKAEMTLLEKVREYLRFLDSTVNIPYEARIELKRMHLSELREAARRGSTLTEVLVAILIMSIGIVSVAAIFPLSVLRTIKATNLTRATNLRYNVEAVVERYPWMITDPDSDFDTAEHINERFIIDPLGRAVSATPATFCGLPRYNGLQFVPGGIPDANALFSDQDSWVTAYEGDVTSLTVFPAGGFGMTQCDVIGLGASGFTLEPGTIYRVVFRDDSGAQFRRVLYSAGDTIRWTEDIDGDNQITVAEDVNGNAGRPIINPALGIDRNALPPNFTPLTARLEYLERRYSYLLTVRRTVPNGGEVDVVVFFGRSFDDDAGYPAVFTNGLRDVVVNYNPAGIRPHAKAGGFILDSSSARWYRITRASDDNLGRIDVVLETPAIQAGTLAALPARIIEVFPVGIKSAP